MPRTNVTGTTAPSGSGAQRCAQAGEREHITDSTARPAIATAAAKTRHYCLAGRHHPPPAVPRRRGPGRLGPGEPTHGSNGVKDNVADHAARTRKRAMAKGLCRWVEDDGGRAAAGYDDVDGGCVPRAIAIATGKPYREVHDALVAAATAYAEAHRDPVAEWIKEGRDGRGFDPDHGCYPAVYRPYLESLGWQFTSTRDQKVRLRADELPSGKVIAQVHQHLVAVIDGKIRDTYDSGGGGRRPVKGYYAYKGVTDIEFLAARIRQEHEACILAVQRGCEHAIEAGRLLIKAKDQLKHGQWLPWLRGHCQISGRTAQLYMQLARLAPNAQHVADLSLRRAMLQLRRDDADKRRREEREEQRSQPPQAQTCPSEPSPAPPVIVEDPNDIADALIGHLANSAYEARVSVEYLVAAFARWLQQIGYETPHPMGPPLNRPPLTGDATSSDWRPTGNGAGVPDIPDFLRRRPVP
jgi:hypothetical protein